MPRGSRPGERRGGRKAGTPNRVGIDVRLAAREYTQEALDTLAAIMRNEKEPAAARVSAANTLLDRGHGKARQPVDHELDISNLTDEQLAVLAAALGAPADLEYGLGGDRPPQSRH